MEKDGMVEVFALSGMMWKLRGSLRKKNIIARRKNCIEAVSPFAVVGERSEKFLKENIDKYGYGNVCNTISLKKNFANMISRNESEFESNFKINPFGENVDVRNSTKYLLISFTELYRPLFKIDGGIYSALNDKEFSSLIGSHERIPFPLPKGFNWKYYLELIVDACLKNYNNDNIILIRSLPREWYVDGNIIGIDEKSHRDLRNFIIEVEELFVEKTHCHCVEEALAHVKSKEGINKSEQLFDCIADSVSRIIKGDKMYLDSYKYVSPISRRLYFRLNRNGFKQLEPLIKICDVFNEVDYEKCLYNDERNNPRLLDLQKLRRFLRREGYSLSDYYRECKKVFDLRVIELYLEFFKLNSDDVLTVLKIYYEVNDKERMRKCINNICNNPDCYPINSMKRFMQENINFLAKYKYVDSELRSSVDIDINKDNMVYPIRLSTERYLLFQPRATKPEDMVFFVDWKEELPDVDTLVNGEMSCYANELNPLSRSLRFYVKRAQSGKANVPLMCEFASEDEFQRSIVFLNYREILGSENAVICKKTNKYALRDRLRQRFMAICNLTPIIVGGAKIFYIGEGLGDQIRYYAYSQVVKSISGVEVYYDDLKIEQNQTFNGLDIRYFVKDKRFDNMLLSKLLSKQLMDEYAPRNEKFGDLLYCEGMDDCLAVTEKVWFVHGLGIKKCDCLITNASNVNNIKLVSKSCFKYYHVLSSPDLYMKDGELNRYISIPEFEDKKNIELEKIMLSCDAVVLHIRCGDALQDAFRVPDEAFFLRCISNLNRIEDYSNKKYFIISDNMNYVKNRMKNFGLDMIDDKDIYYVNHNRGRNSFWDIRLISLGKIIIASYSGFSRIGALLSTRKEIYICQTKSINDIFQKTGFKNKYDLMKE